MRWFGIAEQSLSRLEVVEGDMDRPYLGMEAKRRRIISGRIDEVIHCASDTSFSERKRAQVERTNVTDLSNLLKTIAESKCHFFHHISTAYVAGKKCGPLSEGFVKTEVFTNVYEETKYIAEKTVLDFCRDKDMRLNIYRPSIVYGSARDGRTLSFNALYYPIRVMLFLKNLYEKDIAERGGRKAEAMSVKRQADGSIHLPIRIGVNGTGGINLIPIDFFIHVFMALMEECLTGDVFHIVNSRTTTIKTLIEYTERYFGLSGIRTVVPGSFDGLPRNALETLFEHYIDAYGPYIRDARVFEHDKTDAILEKKGMRCPEMDYHIFSRCMDFAVDAGWGEFIFGDKVKEEWRK